VIADDSTPPPAQEALTRALADMEDVRDQLHVAKMRLLHALDPERHGAVPERDGECPLVRRLHPPEVRQAFHVLRSLTDAQRVTIMCWFCSDCRRYVPPGDACKCHLRG